MTKKQGKLIKRNIGAVFNPDKKDGTITFRIEPELKQFLKSKNVSLSKTCREHLRALAEDLQKTRSR